METNLMKQCFEIGKQYHVVCYNKKGSRIGQEYIAPRQESTYYEFAYKQARDLISTHTIVITNKTDQYRHKIRLEPECIESCNLDDDFKMKYDFIYSFRVCIDEDSKWHTVNTDIDENTGGSYFTNVLKRSEPESYRTSSIKDIKVRWVNRAGKTGIKEGHYVLLADSRLIHKAGDKHEPHQKQ